MNNVVTGAFAVHFLCIFAVLYDIQNVLYRFISPEFIIWNSKIHTKT